MKMTYQKPVTEVVAINCGKIIALSDGVFGNNYGMGYGGVDTDGTKDPSVKGRNLWDEEW